MYMRACVFMHAYMDVYRSSTIYNVVQRYQKDSAAAAAAATAVYDVTVVALYATATPESGISEIGGGGGGGGEYSYAGVLDWTRMIGVRYGINPANINERSFMYII